MKKSRKVLIAFFVAIMMIFNIAQPKTYAFYYEGSEQKPSYTSPSTSESSTKADSALKELEGKIKNSSTNTGAASDVAADIIGWIWLISIIVSIIVLMIIGLKYIMGSVSEKAEYKKSLIPVVVGILILVFATTIVRAIYSIAK